MFVTVDVYTVGLICRLNFIVLQFFHGFGVWGLVDSLLSTLSM